MKTETRIEWTEQRTGHRGIPELFFIIAERIADKWHFAERSTLDLKWEDIPATLVLVGKALAMQARNEPINVRLGCGVNRARDSPL